MDQIISERRARHRQSKPRLPMGKLAAILTACTVTLIGVFCGIEPFDVLIRASASAVLMGLLVAFGTGIIRATDAPRDN